MDLGYAVRMISALADGVDPSTGVILADDELCHDINVARALTYVASYLIVALEESGTTKSYQSNFPARHGKFWSREEDACLLSEFQSGTSMMEIARRHGRSEYAIQCRLIKHGLMEGQLPDNSRHAKPVSHMDEFERDDESVIH